MSEPSTPLLLRGTLLVALAAAVPLPLLAAPAAHVEFTIGDAQLARPGAVAAPLTKGAEVNSGDTVLTNSGRVQLRFSDGAYVSLQPGSEFRIDDYRFDGKTDGTERGVFSLLKGGLRTITGLVGRTNRKAYQVNTSVATIGIRGTEYAIAYTNSITGSVGEGEVQACNAGGCGNFTSGESFFIPSPEIKPTLTYKKTDLPPQQPGDVPGGRFHSANDSTKVFPFQPFAAGDVVTPAGVPRSLSSGSLSSPPVTPITGAPLLDGVYAYNSSSPYYSALTNGFTSSQVVFDASGAVISLAGVLPAAPTTQFGNDGVIGWGQFVESSTLAPVHYAVGLPVSNLSDLVTARRVATYALLGATLPTDSASGAVVGKLDSFVLSVDFGQNNATGTMAMTLKAQQYQAQLTGSFDGPLYFGGSCTVGTCSVNGLGRPFGTDAVRFGAAYTINATPAAGGPFSAYGAAALRQTSLK
jgi:hypothetical protein